MEMIEGKFLVASPHLNDPNFFRSVVYVVRHCEEGAYGLIVNRPTGQRLRCVMEMLLEEVSPHDGPIYYGGPVDGPLVAIHNSPQHADLDCACGLYLSTCQTNLRQVVVDPDLRLRLFDGYAGWEGGQLEEELRQGGWLITDATAEEVLDVEDDLWETLVRRIGRAILSCRFDVSRMPEDPAYN